MKTFEEYEAIAVKVPLSLRNNRDRINFPITGLQQEAGKIGLLLDQAFSSGKFSLPQEQNAELKDRLADVLWCIALLGHETGLSMQDVAAHSARQLEARIKELDPNQR